MAICERSNTNETTSNYEEECKKTSNRKDKAKNPSRKKDKKYKVSEIAVTEEICKTEMENKSNTKELSKDSQTADIYKTNVKETEDTDETERMLENADTVSQEGAKEEICKIAKTKNEEKNDVLNEEENVAMVTQV